MYKCSLAALFISLFFCYIMFIIIVHAFILSTIPWNRIGSHNLFSFRSLRMGMLSELCLCSTMHCSVSTNKRTMWNKKGTHNNSMEANKRQIHTHTISFSLVDFSSSWCFSLFFSSFCFYVWNWLLRIFFFFLSFNFIPFSMHHSLHQGKGMTRSHIQCMHWIREWIECYILCVHCMVERSHFMSEFVVILLCSFSPTWWNRLVEIRKEMNIRVCDTFCQIGRCTKKTHTHTNFGWIFRYF